VAIADTGIGIDKKDQERIFERFEKVNTFVAGTGLGLPICKGIVEQAHGKIGVNSEIGKGATFWFWVPFERGK
jgi:signal transduction histidine kinase